MRACALPLPLPLPLLCRRKNKPSDASLYWGAQVYFILLMSICSKAVHNHQNNFDLLVIERAARKVKWSSLRNIQTVVTLVIEFFQASGRAERRGPPSARQRSAMAPELAATILRLQIPK